VTPMRIVLLLVAGLFFTDYKFGNGRLIELVSAHTSQLTYTLMDHVSAVVHRISP
jgi:hypothetical protein